MSVVLDEHITEQHGIGIPVTFSTDLWERIGGEETRMLDVARILESARQAFAEVLEPVLQFLAPIHGSMTTLVGRVSRERGESVMTITLDPGETPHLSG